MSQKVYADEATLTAQLEKLLSTATTPTQATSVYTDTTISPTQLQGGHHLANEHLSAISTPPLPPLPSPDVTAAAADLLAAAFTAIIRLSRCAAANKNLRESAEASSRASNTRAEELAARLQLAEAKLRKRDAVIAGLRNAESETASKHRAEVRRLSAECGQLRSRLLHAGHRENQLVLAAKKKDKEFGQLQSRVHALFKASASIDARITRVGNRVTPRGDLNASVEELGEERSVAVDRENDLMRGLLQAVLEELDDLILSHGDAVLGVSEELDVPPAPGDEVMELPMEVIGTDLQDCLERKFGILRRALERGPVGEEGHDGAEGDELVDGFDGQGDEHGEDSADSAGHSVELMTGNVEGCIGDGQSDCAGAERVAQVDAEAAPVDAEAEPIENEAGLHAGKVNEDAEQVDEEAERVEADAELVEEGAERVDIDVETVEEGSETFDGDDGMADAETTPINTPVDTEAVAEADPVPTYPEPVARSTEPVDAMHETLEDDLRTLSITEPCDDPTERTNATD